MYFLQKKITLLLILYSKYRFMYKYIFSIIFWVWLLILILYIWDIKQLIYSIISIMVYALCYLCLEFLWRKIRKKTKRSIWESIHSFFYRVWIMLSVLFVIIGWFTYYQNEISPAPMPEYTLSNGNKEVVFQAMSHIGSHNFYAQVQQNLTKYKQSWWVYFFEGVRPGTIENMNAFNEALGINFDPKLYENFSQLYWVSYQDNTIFFGLVNNLDFNVDLSIDDIMKIYNESNTPNDKWGSLEVIDINSEIEATLTQLKPKQLSFLQYINKGILNFMIKSEDLQNTITNNFLKP